MSLGVISARRFVLLQREHRAATVTLEEKVKELQLKSSEQRAVNDELMRQIDQRSRRLLDAMLSRLNDESGGQQRSRYGDLHWALPILKQIATGLAAIPDRGILHRDLKPANILIASSAATAPPRVKLVDFGISILARDTDLSDPTPTPSDRNAIPDATSTGVLVGTVRDALPLFVDVLRGGLSPQEAILRAR